LLELAELLVTAGIDGGGVWQAARTAKDEWLRVDGLCRFSEMCPFGPLVDGMLFVLVAAELGIGGGVSR
jgi:hypothetical protein